ncbi:unnamed protein product [Brassica rapa]|uniref:Uncharacterized protein n=2 Tax=Brassica TaxID=3705 RepID=A0A8D9H9E6_BRACM|nr:unnamed protein product [Brassica napus]CAG7895503.1 unnamed protein product [Brassica rapa]
MVSDGIIVAYPKWCVGAYHLIGALCLCFAVSLSLGC